ncbi:thioredoxin [Candidatus Schneideria nysicola]|uniref:thioredoxin n=1 Tax=Candidatus Schneideria nysicola TaxID=1081631 RepID=UPI001CAA65D4|nr:thioredoxin [Candidatus Schneideria nysicola]UAJ65418.1 thioredoxin [Candidatus Schneideria nysicola]UAJ65948.1 thioredoxin [Candidatus Schneideria nysicola]
MNNVDNKIIYLNDKNFDKVVLQSDTACLVDFWADWCAPCKQISAILDEICKDFDKNLIIAKLNVSEYTSIANKYNIRSIPTLLLFRNGEVIANKTGSCSKEQLMTFLRTSI